MDLPPGAAYGTIGVLAALENIFPPVPADTAVALGAFLSREGGILAPWVFAVTWFANSVSAALVFVLARTAGRDFVTSRVGQRLVPAWAMRRMERAYERYGLWGIFVSRLVPGIRAVVPPFAGLAGLGAARALIPTVVASGLWYGALTIVVARLARERNDVVRIVSHLSLWTLSAVAVIAGACIVAALMRRRARPAV